MIPVFLSQKRCDGHQVASSMGAALTIHNLLDQGKGTYDLFAYAGLPSHWHDSHFEFHGGTNCFKAGLMTADVVTTVSPTYAREICSR
jgi:starch synthase